MSGGEQGDTDPDQWADLARTYDVVASAYADAFVDELTHKPFDRELLDRFVASVAERTSAEHPVCDLGCGPGHVGGYLAGHGVNVIGIDLSAAMVAEAQRRFPGLRFAPGDMESLHLPDGSFSAIACFYALIHIPRVRVPAVLRELRRVLVDQGALLLAVHGGAGSLHATEMLDHQVPFDATLFGLDELAALVEVAGFAVVEAHQRDPYPSEHPTPRLYLWAVKQG
jgi:SAM-dependent methyltransferase